MGEHVLAGVGSGVTWRWGYRWDAGDGWIGGGMQGGDAGRDLEGGEGWRGWSVYCVGDV